MRNAARIRVMALGWCVLGLVASTAWADTVYLTNGDRLSGTVTQVDAGALVITTDYAGEVSIPLDHVRAMETDEPVAVRLNDGDPATGSISFDGESIVFESDGGAEVIEPTEISALAPNLDALLEREAAAAEAAKPKYWSGSAELGVSIRSGERDTFDANTAITLTRKWEANTLSLKLNGAYGEAESNVNTQRLKGEAKYQYQPGGPMYYFTIASLEHDDARRLELRGTFGGGIGYDFIKNDRRTFSGEFGAEYSHERWKNFARGERRALEFARRMAAGDGLIALATDVANGDRPFNLRAALEGGMLFLQLADPDLRDPIRTEDQISLRLALHYEQTIFKESKITNDLLVLPPFDNPGDFRAINDLAFSTPLRDNLSLRISLHTEYDNDPGSPGVDEFDNTLLTSLRYEF